MWYDFFRLWVYSAPNPLTLRTCKQVYCLKRGYGELMLTKGGKIIAVFSDPESEDEANKICNVLNAEEQRWRT